MKIWYTNGLSNTIHAMKLLKQGYGGSITLAGSHVNPDAPVRHIADEFFPEPGGTAGYGEWVLEQAQAIDADLVIAQRRPQDLWPLADRFEEAGIRLQLPAAPEALHMIDRKDLFGLEMELLGLPYPSFEIFKTLEEFDEAREAMHAEGRAPEGVCVKPVTGIFGSGFRALKDDVSDMDRLLKNEFYEISTARFRNMLSEAHLKQDMLLMRFLPGIERSVDFLARDGELVAGAARVKQSGHQVIEAHGEALDLAAVLARRFGLNGICNMQTREGADGRQYILEVNPRMSGGMQMACLAGVNLPAWDVALALDLRPASEIPPVRSGLIVGTEETPVIRDEALAAE